MIGAFVKVMAAAEPILLKAPSRLPCTSSRIAIDQPPGAAMPSRAIRHAVGPHGYRVAQIQDGSGEVVAFGLYGPDGALDSQYPDLDAAMAALDTADPPVDMPDEGSPEDWASR